MIQDFFRMIPVNISRREKLFLGGGGCFVLVFLIFLLLIQPVFQKREQLSDKLVVKQQELVEMREMRVRYQALESRAKMAEKRYSERAGDFTLFSFMDRLAGNTGIKDNISYMKPGTQEDKATGLKVTYVELKIQDITLEELISYLYFVETSESMVTVDKLTVSREGGENGLLSVVMQAKTFGA
ncbi:MAG: type II secretion system protein M [Desulfobacteraceae bacterium]|nr:type II secretion system protein M [Desulfobacteraceae bacterium]